MKRFKNGVRQAASGISPAREITRVTVSKTARTPLLYDVKNIITGEN